MDKLETKEIEVKVRKFVITVMKWVAVAFVIGLVTSIFLTAGGN